VRALAILLFLGSAGCSAESPAAPKEPTFELRSVAKPALAAAEAKALRAVPTAVVADVEAIEAVLGALGSPDARMQRLALADARALGDGGVGALAQVLADAEAPAARRNAAAEALGAIATPSAVDALALRMESDRQPWVRAQCAWRIQSAGLDEAVVRLVLRLKYETDGATVVWIANALASLGNFAGLDGLRVVRDTSPDADARTQAADRLAAIAGERGFESGDALYVAWATGDSEDRIRAQQPSDALRREAWDRIVRLGEFDLRRVDDARFVLARLEPWIVPHLADALADTDVYTRVHTAQVLERRGPRARAAVPTLIAALADPRLGPQAAVALGAIGDRSATPAIEGLLRDGRDLERRTAAARALATLGGPTSIELLASTAKPAEPLDLRQASAGALVALGEGDAWAPFLLECLTSPSADVGAAENALGAWFAVEMKAGSAPWPELAERWRALEPAPGSVPDAAEVARRRAERAAIVREAIATR